MVRYYATLLSGATAAVAFTAPGTGYMKECESDDTKFDLRQITGKIDIRYPDTPSGPVHVLVPMWEKSIYYLDAGDTKPKCKSTFLDPTAINSQEKWAGFGNATVPRGPLDDKAFQLMTASHGVDHADLVMEGLTTADKVTPLVSAGPDSCSTYWIAPIPLAQSHHMPLFHADDVGILTSKAADLDRKRGYYATHVECWVGGEDHRAPTPFNATTPGAGFHDYFHRDFIVLFSLPYDFLTTTTGEIGRGDLQVIAEERPTAGETDEAEAITVDGLYKFSMTLTEVDPKGASDKTISSGDIVKLQWNIESKPLKYIHMERLEGLTLTWKYYVQDPSDSSACIEKAGKDILYDRYHPVHKVISPLVLDNVIDERDMVGFRPVFPTFLNQTFWNFRMMIPIKIYNNGKEQRASLCRDGEGKLYGGKVPVTFIMRNTVSLDNPGPVNSVNSGSNVISRNATLPIDGKADEGGDARRRADDEEPTQEQLDALDGGMFTETAEFLLDLDTSDLDDEVEGERDAKHDVIQSSASRMSLALGSAAMCAALAFLA